MSEYTHLIEGLKRKPLSGTEPNGMIRHNIDNNTPFYHNLPSVPYNVTNRNCSIDKIVNSIPEITTEIDVPEFVSIDQSFTQRPQSLNFVNNINKHSRTARHCFKNGYYIYDHDYLEVGSGIMVYEEIDPCAGFPNSDHTYAISVHPSYLYIDLKQPKSFQCQDFREGKVYMCVLCSRNFISRRGLISHFTSHRKPETQMERHENEIVI